MSQASRTLLMLVVLLAAGIGVGLYAWKGVYEGDEKATEVKNVDERLFSPLKAGEKQPDGGLPRYEFVKLKLTSGGQTTVLEREPGGGAWKMTAPFTAGVDRIAVDGVTSQLQTSKFKYVADENPDDAALKKYGLEDPAFVVEAEALVGDAKERRSVTLRGGAENTFNGSIFMRRNDEKKVWGAEGGVKWSFQKSPVDLREKEVIALEEQKVSRITVKTKNNDYVLERDADRNWVVEQAKPAKGEDKRFLADQNGISGSINGLKNERALGFPAEQPATEPFEDLLFEQEDAGVRVKLWKLGGEDAGRERTIAWREDARGTVLAEVSPTSLSFFDRHPWDLRDRSLLQFKKDAVAKVTFHLADGTDLTVEKETADAGGAETWRATAPVKGAAKQFKIAALMWTLGSLKASDVLEDKPKDLKKFGFDRWVSLADANGKELARLQLGGDVKDRPGFKYLKGSRDQVVAGDAQRLADMPAKVEDLLETPPPVAVDGGTP